MFCKVIFLVFVTCVTYSSQDGLLVSLYYEGLCPYCHEFILEQLYPAYQIIGNRLFVDLVPLGNARHTTENNRTKWICQHGDLECYINKINACAINTNYTTQTDLMDFVNCLIANSTFANTKDVETEIATKCAESSNLSWNDINTCLTSDMADNLLLRCEARQQALIPKLSYVPHIIFNDKFDPTLEDQAREDFLGTACKLFKIKPNKCTKILFKSNDTYKPKKKKGAKKCSMDDFDSVNNFYNNI